MGGLAECQISQAMDALVRRDRGRAKRLIDSDVSVDAAQRAIEERIVNTIATRRLVAVDLRVVIATLRIACELERIGDLAKNIAKRVIAMQGAELPRGYQHGLEHLAVLTLAQVHDVLDSVATRDLQKAQSALRQDGEIDNLYGSLFIELLNNMGNDPASLSCEIDLLFCAKNFECIGDHAANIARAVCYMVSGHPHVAAPCIAPAAEELSDETRQR